MQVSVESLEGLERTITVTLPSDRVDTSVTKKLQGIRKTAKINGFRPGKVPMRVVEKRYGGQVRQEVLGDVIQSTYQEAIAQEKLRPAGWPSIETVNADSDSEIKYKATFEVYPEVELNDMSGVKIKRPKTDIQDSDIAEMLENLRSQHVTYEAVERASKNADQVVINFSGFIEGKEFEGGQAKDAPLVLGSGAMIEGFEAQIEGLSAGENKRIKVSFPENYHAEELSGKEAEFDIEVLEVQEAHLPELDDALASLLGVADGGIDKLRTDIRNNMERELRESIEAIEKQQVMDGLLAANDVTAPKALVSEEVGRLREQFLERLSQQMGGAEVPEGASFPDDMFKEEAERRVKLGLVVAEVIKTAELSADTEAVRARVEQMAAAYEDPSEVISYYYSNRELIQNIEAVVLEQAVTHWVISQASASDEVLSFSELMERRKNAGQVAAEDGAEE